MKKRLSIALLLLLVFSTYRIQNNFNLNTLVKISKISVVNNKILKEEKIKKELSFLYEKNLFLLNNKLISNKLKELDVIKSFEIKKIYPNKIIIKIFEKEPIAIIQNKQKKNYYTKSGDLISFFYDKEFENLPIVFGEKKSFIIFYNDLRNINFPTNEIKIFYLFESKRWDIVTNKDKLIKLPVKNYQQSLKNFMDIKNKTNFNQYKTFDYRIKNQLILK